MTVNWGDTHIHLGLWGSVAVAVFLILFMLIVCIWDAKSVAKKKWSCPKCYTSFGVNWKSAFPPVHYGDEYLVKCPKCKKRHICVESHLE